MLKTEINTDGLDELISKAGALEKEQSVPLTDLFPDAFIGQNTHFHSFAEMLEASGFQDGPEADAFFNAPAWNVFVAAGSRFGGWEEMQAAAAEQFILRQLGF